MKLDTVSKPPLRTIMIVDDAQANVGVLGWYFEENGFRVIVAQDGEEAIERAQLVRPDLILLDVLMPGIDGFETCRRLKMIDDIKEIPVIFMTALSDTNEKISGFKAGGVDYVTKPCQIEEVLARVNTHLSVNAMQKKIELLDRKLSEESQKREQVEQELQGGRSELREAYVMLEKARQQLQQSEKMAALGERAVIAINEIATPIASTNANLGLLKDFIKDLLLLIDSYEKCGAAGVALSDKDIAEQNVRSLRAKFNLDLLGRNLQNLLSQSCDDMIQMHRIVQNLKEFCGYEWITR